MRGSPPRSQRRTARRRSSTTGRSTSRRSSTCRAGPGLSVFPETGYAVVRARGLWLAFDCGPPAPDFLPAHAHADALSFQLWLDGRPVVVDPGRRRTSPARSATQPLDPPTRRSRSTGGASSSPGALSGRGRCRVSACSAPSRSPRRSSGPPGRVTGARSLGRTEIRVDDELELPRGREPTPCRWPRTPTSRSSRSASWGWNRGTIHLGASLRPQRGTALAARGEAEGRFAQAGDPRPR